MSNFPTNPSTGATHAIGDKTWEYNGSAWQKIFSGDGIRAIGISGGAVTIGRSGLNFDSDTVGLTLSLHSSGNTASLIIKGDALASTSGRAEYTYTVVSGVLNPPNATSNGQFIYNDDTGQISIFKFDNDGEDFRTELSSAAAGGVEGVSSKINVVVGSDDRTKVFEVDAEQVTYDGTNFDAASSNLQGNTAGTGKKVTVFIDQGSAFIRAKEYRFPDGTSASSIVTSFNGETGDVTTTSTVLPVAGITATSGITIGGDINFTQTDDAVIRNEGVAQIRLNSTNTNIGGVTFGVIGGGMTLGNDVFTPNSFHMRNPEGEAFLDVSTTNVQIGDTNSVNNGTKILVRDSHNVISQTAATSISLNTPDVPINSKLSHSGDADTYLDFAENNNLVLRAGGNTAMNATATNTDIGGVTFGLTGGSIHLNGLNNTSIALAGPAGKNISHNGTNVFYFDQPNGVIRAIIYSFQTSREVSHSGDSDTFLRFPSNNNLQLSAGGNIGLHMTASHTTIGTGVTFGIGGGATFDGIIQAQGLTLGPGGVTFPDGTNMKTAAAGGGGGVTSSIGFIIDGNGSPITTGIKLDALKQIPVGSQVVRTSAYVQSGVTGYSNQLELSFKKIPTLSSIASEIGTGGTTLDIGITASSDQTTFVFNGTTSGTVFYRELGNLSNSTGATIDAREWVFPHVLNNNANVDKIQFFIEMAPT